MLKYNVSLRTVLELDANNSQDAINQLLYVLKGIVKEFKAFEVSNIREIKAPGDRDYTNFGQVEAESSPIK